MLHPEANWHPLCRQGLCLLCPVDYDGPQSMGISGEGQLRRPERYHCGHECHDADK